MKTGGVFLVILVAVNNCIAQVDPAKIRVFIECNFSGLCDMDYLRNNLPVIDFVRDRFQADMHMFLVSQPTGAGGESHVLNIVRPAEPASTDTLKFFTAGTSTEDERRGVFLQYIKIALLPYLIKNKSVDKVEINFVQKGDAAPTKDKWKAWVFTIGGRGSLNGDKNYNEHSYGFNASASKVTEKYKSSFSMYEFESRNIYRYTENGEKQELKTTNKYRDVNYDYIRSLSPRWSVGSQLLYRKSSYDNFRDLLSIAIGAEYNIYPYKLSSNKFLVLRYRISTDARKYYEETLFGKNKEVLFSNDIGLYAAYTQKWGSITGSLSWYNYLHDVSKNNVSLNLMLEVRLIKGLSVSFHGNGSIINDQLNIARQGADSQEILLRLKALSTSYNYYTGFGLNYRFGSAFNNIVNPRFTNGRYY